MWREGEAIPFTQFNFYSHIPCGMWHRFGSKPERKINFYSHIPCGMWPEICWSISCTKYFYSHIPCGMWQAWRHRYTWQPEFLLTHPVWDVTGCPEMHGCPAMHFYSHIPCGMWRVGSAFTYKPDRISTHTSRVGCDDGAGTMPEGKILQFLLTHPVWDVTFLLFFCMARISISTHTSRVGCDRGMIAEKGQTYNFYSHIPCGMWRPSSAFAMCWNLFLLTHPVWDVTNLFSTAPFAIAFLLTHPVWDVTW